MNDMVFSILVSILGYIFLWTLGSLLFLTYFRIFTVPSNIDYTEKVRKIPHFISIATVPLCSILSFYLATKLLLVVFPASGNMVILAETGAIALVFTVVIDLVVTPLIEKIKISTYPMNLMYLFAWIVIIPSVLLAGIY